MVAVATMVLAFFIVPEQWQDSNMQVQGRAPLLIVIGCMYLLLAGISVAALRNPLGAISPFKTSKGRKMSSKWTLKRVNGKLQFVDVRRLQDPEGYSFIAMGTTMLGVTVLLLSACVLGFLAAWTPLCQMLSVVITILVLLAVSHRCTRHYTVDGKQN